MMGMRVWPVLAACLLKCLALSSAGKTVMETYHVHTSIANRFANTRVVGIFRNAENEAQEIFFGVAMPKTAFIVDCSIETGGRSYKGQVRERTVISRDSTRTAGSDEVSQGGNADQIEAFRDGTKFEVSAKVEGGADVTFIISYVQMLERKYGVYEQQIHLSPGQVVKDFVVEVFIVETQPLTVLTAPALRQPNQTVGRDDKEEANPLAKLDHPSPNSGHVIFVPAEAEQGQGGFLHTFVVKYDVQHNPKGEIIKQGNYFTHFYVPAGATSMPKDIAFVIDVSGSMDGNKLDQVKVAMHTILEDLEPHDKFNIVPFSTWAYTWKNSSVSVTADYIREAKMYVENLEAAGFTDIYDGITVARKVLNNEHDNSNSLKVIFFLTDGQDRAELEIDTSVSIYGLAFGEDADYEYIKSLSAKNSGFAKVIYEDLDAAAQVTNFYQEISSASAKNVKFSYPSEAVDESSLTQTEFPVIFEGSEAHVTGKWTNDADQFRSEITATDNSGQLTIEATADDVKEISSSEVADQIPTSNYSTRGFPQLDKKSMERSWAYLKIQQLLKEELKNAMTAENVTTLEDILDLSVKYDFVTPLTSIILRDPETRDQLMEAVAWNEDEDRSNTRIDSFINNRPPTTTEVPTTTTTEAWCPPNSQACRAFDVANLVTTILYRILNVLRNHGG